MYETSNAQSGKSKVVAASFSMTYACGSDGVARMQIGTNLPARLDKIQASKALGFKPNDLLPLKLAGILYPMGGCPKKGKRCYASNFYSLVDVCELAADSERMHDAQHCISEYNSRHNDKRLSKPKNG